MLEAATNLSQPFTMFGYSEETNIEGGIIYVRITNPPHRKCFSGCANRSHKDNYFSSENFRNSNHAPFYEYELCEGDCFFSRIFVICSAVILNIILLSVATAIAWWLSGYDTKLTGENKKKDLIPAEPFDAARRWFWWGYFLSCLFSMAAIPILLFLSLECLP